MTDQTPRDRAARFRALADAHGSALPGKPVINFQWRPTYRDPIERHELTLDDLRAAADALDSLPEPEDPALVYLREELADTALPDYMSDESLATFTKGLLDEIRRIEKGVAP